MLRFPETKKSGLIKLMEKVFWSGVFLALLVLAMVFVPYSPFPLLTPNMQESVIAELGEMGAAFPLAFGGRVLWVEPCTCSAGAAIAVGPPRPGYFLFQPGISVLFSFYAFVPANYVLGTYIPGGVCLTGIPPACATVPTLGTVVLMGTSATPLSPSL